MTQVRSRVFLFGALLISTLAFAPASAQTTGQITGLLVAGATTITGTVRGATRTDVQLCDIDSGILLDLKAGTTVPTDGNGTFTAELLYPLVAGERIRLEQPPPAPSIGNEPCSGMPGATLLGPPVTVIGAASWGRSRVTFMAGTVISNDNQFQAQSLSQASLFLDVTAEKNWAAGGVNSDCGSAAHPDCMWNRRWLFNTYFTTRLTSVPESQQTTPTGGLPGFVGSRKSAILEGGAYLPVLMTKWVWQNAPNALFVAPLSKLGFITPTGADAAAQPVNPQQFYKYYEWGGRVGHYKLPLDRNEAPEPISYVDVTLGRFSNLETLVPVENASGLARPVEQYRVAIEGVLQIPATPLVIGFSANIGQRLTRTPYVQTANDDLRFFFGARFDLGKLLSKLPQF